MAKKKSTPSSTSSELISNWVQSNESRLSEIATENPTLYDAINKALNYLSGSLGGSVLPVVQPIKKEAVEEAPKETWRVKTKEELQTEDGSDWKAKNVFYDEMLWMLGKPIESVLSESALNLFYKALKNGTLYEQAYLTEIDYDPNKVNWYINANLVTNKPLPTLQESIEIDLDEGIKINVRTPEGAEAFQKWAFSRGVTWASGSTTVDKTEYSYFFIENLKLTFATSISTFNQSKKKEVTLKDLGISLVSTASELEPTELSESQLEPTQTETTTPLLELPVSWTELPAQRPNYLEILQLLKKRRLSKDDKVQIVVFFGKFSLLTKGSIDFENYEKNQAAAVKKTGDSFVPNPFEFYQRYDIYPEFVDLFDGYVSTTQRTNLQTFDWIQELIYPNIKTELDDSNENLKARNFIVENEKQNRGFSLVEKEMKEAEEASKKSTKKSPLDKYKTDDDDLESALEDLEI